MFLRRHTRTKNDQTYAYWTLVESLRTVDGPRQRIVATIGKLPGLDESAGSTYATFWTGGCVKPIC